MPSALHEAVLELVRNRPDLPAMLARDALGVELPVFRRARVREADFTQIVPAEYRADLVVTLGPEEIGRAPCRRGDSGEPRIGRGSPRDGRLHARIRRPASAAARRALDACPPAAVAPRLAARWTPACPRPSPPLAAPHAVRTTIVTTRGVSSERGIS